MSKPGSEPERCARPTEARKPTEALWVPRFQRNATSRRDSCDEQIYCLEFRGLCGSFATRLSTISPWTRAAESNGRAPEVASAR